MEPMNRERFFKLLHSKLTISQLEQVQAAYWLSKRGHEKQTRSTGERYFEHPRQAACILLQMGICDVWTIVLALLHDSLEDTVIPQLILRKTFDAKDGDGEFIYKGLLLLNKKIPHFHPMTGWVMGYSKTKSTEAYFKEILTACFQVRCVKLADRIHNLMTCGDFSKERKEKYIVETETYVLPIAHATGVGFVLKIQELLAELKFAA
jgi:(p)ppGpp synthase/HD superfamily hydrolase